MVVSVAVHGHCDPWFNEVQEAFKENFERGEEHGAAVCAIVDGRMVVDLWAGVAVRNPQQPWQRDTMANVYSATKGVSSLCLLHLADRGGLDLSQPVCSYWPEFATAGKGDVTVAQLLSHQAGLAAIDKPLPHQALYSQDTMARALAEQVPNFPLGSGHGYHAQTFGFLVAELVRRVAGISLGQYLRREIAGPRGIDFFIGFGPELDHRVARVTRPLGQTPPLGQPDFLSIFRSEPDSLTSVAFNNPKPKPGAVNTRAFRAAEMPGSNGHGTARALAQLYASAAGALDNRPLLSAEALAWCHQNLVDGPDQVLRVRTSFGAGFLRSHDAPFARMGASASESAFGHPGMGGSMGCADPAAGLGFGYVVNRASASILVDERARRLLDACTAAL